MANARYIKAEGERVPALQPGEFSVTEAGAPRKVYFGTGKGNVYLLDKTAAIRLIDGAIEATVTDARVLAAFEQIASAAAGDIFYLDADGDLVRLPIGTTGQVLTVVDGVPAWATA